MRESELLTEVQKLLWPEVRRVIEDGDDPAELGMTREECQRIYDQCCEYRRSNRPL